MKWFVKQLMLKLLFCVAVFMSAPARPSFWGDVGRLQDYSSWEEYDEEVCHQIRSVPTHHAILFVDSAAAGANNGTSWTNAWTSILSADAAASTAGDEIRIASGHTETGTIGTLAFTGATNANPIKIFSCNKADDTLLAGASITCNSGALAINGAVIVDGVTFTQSANAAFNVNGTGNFFQRWRGCTFKNTGTNTGGVAFNTAAQCFTYLIDCDVDLSGNTTNGTAISTGSTNGTLLIARGGTWSARSANTQTNFFVNTGNGARALIEGVTLTNTTTNLHGGGTNLTGQVTLRSCVLNTFTNNLSTALTIVPSLLLQERCVAGTFSVGQIGLSRLDNYWGTVTSDLTRYRDTGASDGVQANNHSWAMVSNGNALSQYSLFYGPDMVIHVPAGSATVRMYFASGGSLNDNDVGFELISLNETATPNTTAKARTQWTNTANRGTAAALTTDSVSTWTGAGVGTKQYAELSINPAVAGPLILRPWVAKASATVYIDPKIEVSGLVSNSQRFMDGVQFCGPNEHSNTNQPNNWQGGLRPRAFAPGMAR